MHIYDRAAGKWEIEGRGVRGKISAPCGVICGMTNPPHLYGLVPSARFDMLCRLDAESV